MADGLKILRTTGFRWLTTCVSGIGAAVLAYWALRMSGLTLAEFGRSPVTVFIAVGMAALAGAGSAHAYFAGGFDANEAYRELLRRDEQTGLSSRTGFSSELREYVDRAEPGQRSFLISLEFSALRDINDSFGRDVGDKVLLTLADRLKRIISSYGPLGRMGGGEFAFCLNTSVDDSELRLALDPIIQFVSKPVVTASVTHAISCSAGIYEIIGRRYSDNEAMRCANLARIHAEKSGRGTWSVYHNAMGEAAQHRRWIEAELTGAIKRNELTLNYQPQVAMPGGKVVGYEALLRWNHYDAGAISPDEFIPVAEQSGLIQKIGTWVLRQACRDMRYFPSDVKLSVNVARAQLERDTFLRDVKKILIEEQADANQLEFEITESMLIRDHSSMQRVFDELRDMGVSVAIDDFGTGYSNLATLARLRFEKLKIDKSFVDDLVSEHQENLMITPIIQLARTLGAKVIAEGVETEVQSRILQKAGCSIMQGYLYGKPMPIDAVRALFPKTAEHNKPQPIKLVVNAR